jgi:signal transduction histidine kinase
MDGVDFHVEATDLGTARLDEVKTRQILLNLLTNALKFTTVGEVRLSVERWDREGMPWLRFVVQDTGIGIHADQLERIFEPFAQADATTERKFGGTGLGLSISQAFTRMMGGEIYVTSEVGSGTRFTVELPIGELRQLRTPGQALRTAMPAQPSTLK